MIHSDMVSIIWTEHEWFLNGSVWSIVGTLKVTITSGQSGPGSNSN